jgi:nicotinamide-nucleotide adenylyltransferase/phosphinothricin biosynthesis protein PhpF
VLIIGITNPDPWQMGNEETDVNRGSVDANPFTFYERYLMVEGSMVEAGVPREAFRIVPFPHSYPERLRYYSPADALYFLSIYDSWGETKLERFRNLRLPVHVLWRREKKVTSGSRIRKLIQTSGDWEKWVPPATARVIRELGIDERIRNSQGAPLAIPKSV